MYNIIIDNIEISVFILFSISFFISIMSILLGIGGGFILVPFLVLLGIPAPIAVGTSYAQIFASSTMAVSRYHHLKIIPYSAVFFLTLFGLIGACFGILTFSMLSQNIYFEGLLKAGFIVLLAIAIILLFFNPVHHIQNQKPDANKIKYYIYSAIGIVIGFISGLMGVGGGFLIVPCLIFFMALTLQNAKAISQFNIMCVSLVSLIMHGFVHHNFNIKLAIVLFLGSIFGTIIGLKYEKLFSETVSRSLFMIVLIITIILLIYDMMSL